MYTNNTNNNNEKNKQDTEDLIYLIDIDDMIKQQNLRNHKAQYNPELVRQYETN